MNAVERELQRIQELERQLRPIEEARRHEEADLSPRSGHLRIGWSVMRSPPPPLGGVRHLKVAKLPLSWASMSAHPFHPHTSAFTAS